MDTLNEILELCLQDSPALRQSRHGFLETHEPDGSLAFEALLAFIDRLPYSELHAALELANDRLASIDSHQRREVATIDSLRPLIESPSWPLVRSLTYFGNLPGAPSIETAPSPFSGIVSASFCGGLLGQELIADFSSQTKTPHLRSLDLSGCTLETAAETVLTHSTVFSRLHTFHGLTEQDLESFDAMQLETVSCYATGRLIHLLEERSASSLRQLTLTGSADSLTEVINALCESKTLTKHLESLSLYLDIDDKQLSQLMTCADLSNLRQLTIYSEAITSNSFTALSSAEFARNLTTLNLSFTKIGSRGWKQLGTIPFSSLESLNLQGTGGGNAGAEALSRSDYLTRLQTLNISRNQIGPDGITAICGSEILTELKSLNICNNPLGSAGARAIAFSNRTSALRHLWINQIGNSGTSALASSPSLQNLESLTIGFLEDNSTGEACVALAESGILAGLKELSVTGGVSDAGLKSLATSTTCRELRRLALSGNVTDEGIEALAHAQQLSGLWHLKLDHCPIGDRGALALANSEILQELIDLQLSFCKLTEQGSRSLAQSNNVRSLRWLSLNRELLQPWLISSGISPLLRARLQESEK